MVVAVLVDDEVMVVSDIEVSVDPIKSDVNIRLILPV